MCPPPAYRCALCSTPDGVIPVHFSHGVRIALCARHGTPRYLGRDQGRAVVRRLTELWTSHGMLTKNRVRALGSHLRRIERTRTRPNLPGSYAWRSERDECEHRFGRGDALADVISDIRDPARWGGRPAPSERTIRRWYAQARWLAPPTPPDRPLATLGRAAEAALTIALEIATSYAWEEWIRVHGGPSRGELRIRRALQRE